MRMFSYRPINLLLGFVILLSGAGFSQPLDPLESKLFNISDSINNSISIFAEGGLQSQEIPVSFGAGWLRGGNIDNEIEDALRNDWSRSRARGTAKMRVDVFTGRKASSKSWLSLSSSSSLWGNAARDGFSLVFDGTAGVERASLRSEFLARAVHWQVGYGKFYSKPRLAWSMNAGLITSGFIFSASDAEFIRRGYTVGPAEATDLWQAVGNLQLTRFTSPSPTLSINLHSLIVKAEAVKILFSAADMGIAYLINSEVLRSNDTLLFNGISTDDLFNLNSFGDSLAQSLPDTAMENKIIALPASFKLHGVIKLSEKVNLCAQVSYQVAVKSIPSTLIGLDYKISSSIVANPYLGYGGFTNFFGGLGINGNFKKFNISLHAVDVRGIFNLKSQGLMIQTQLSYAI